MSHAALSEIDRIIDEIRAKVEYDKNHASACHKVPNSQFLRKSPITGSNSAGDTIKALGDFLKDEEKMSSILNNPAFMQLYLFPLN